MGKLCVSDPEKLSRVCSSGNNLTLQLSQKGKKHFKKAQKAYEKNSNMSDHEKDKFSKIMKSSANSHLNINSNDVKSAVCVNNKEGFDQLVILHSKESILSNKFRNPILPIAIQQGKCNKLVEGSFLKKSVQPKEVFVNTAKNELSELRQHL